MDWITIVVGAVCSLLGALGGGGIFYIRENKRGKQIDNNEKVIEEWKEMYHEKEKKCNEKDTIITQKDAKIEELRKRINSLLEERGEFMANRELELKKKDGDIFQQQMRILELEWNECRVNGCNNRQPPRDRKKCIGCNSECENVEVK